MSLVASVTLNRSFLALASDPSNFIVCGTAGSIGGGGSKQDVITQEGAFRNYANFVTRLILGSAKTRVFSFALRALTPAQVTQVESWVGQTCIFRDTYGRRMFGSYVVVTETDIPLSGKAHSTLLTDVQIDFQAVNYIEGV